MKRATILLLLCLANLCNAGPICDYEFINPGADLSLATTGPEFARHFFRNAYVVLDGEPTLVGEDVTVTAKLTGDTVRVTFCERDFGDIGSIGFGEPEAWLTDRNGLTVPPVNEEVTIDGPHIVDDRERYYDMQFGAWGHVREATLKFTFPYETDIEAIQRNNQVFISSVGLTVPEPSELPVPLLLVGALVARRRRAERLHRHRK